jgi:hypothetical protein
MIVVIAKEVHVRKLNYKLCIVSRDRLLIQATGITIHLLTASAKVWSNIYGKGDILPRHDFGVEGLSNASRVVILLGTSEVATGCPYSHLTCSDASNDQKQQRELYGSPDLGIHTMTSVTAGIPATIYPSTHH